MHVHMSGAPCKAKPRQQQAAIADAYNDAGAVCCGRLTVGLEIFSPTRLRNDLPSSNKSLAIVNMPCTQYYSNSMANLHEKRHDGEAALIRPLQ